MNPKLKRTKLNAAFKKVQRLPSLAPRTEEARPTKEKSAQHASGMRVIPIVLPPPGQQFLAE
jgi:hypothetical protein